MKQSYALQKLTSAVYALGTGGGSIRDRVHAAYAYHLIHIRPGDLPEGEMRDAFVGIRDDLTFEDGDEGRLRATLTITSDEDASGTARGIIDLYRDLQSALHEHPAPVVQNVYQLPEGVDKVIHEVRWLPSDPSDKSLFIAQEPDGPLSD